MPGYTVKPSDVPADAVTSSGSGLDPDISPEYADLQVHRVAEKNNLSVDQVQKLVDEHTDGRTLGFIGEPTRQRPRTQHRAQGTRGEELMALRAPRGSWRPGDTLRIRQLPQP